MKIKSLSIENFRGYESKTTIEFDKLTTFVGKNDIGKSTILEALDVFFYDGKGLIKLDKNDINVNRKKKGETDVKISVIFNSLPTKVILDETNETELKREFLLNADGELEICKTFKNASTTAIKVDIVALHPSNNNCKDLLQKKNTDLKKIVDSLHLDCNKTKNSEMRLAIWDYYKDDLQQIVTSIDVSSKEGDIKSIWTKLQTYLPCYSLFQADRKNSDGDDEIQDPLKEAVKQIIRNEDLKSKLQEIADKVREKVQEVADLTLQKIQEMNPDIANSLHPNIPSSENLKWADVFKNLSISGDEDIPINKRGSGVKRLILLNFFRAEAERRKEEGNNPSIIYAIEEPETSQHKEHQVILVNALKSLIKDSDTQVILTTHSSDIVQQLNFEDIRLLIQEQGKTIIKGVEERCLSYPSLNEVNYLAFGDATEEYHNELYGYLQSIAVNEEPQNGREQGFENWLSAKGCDKSKQWCRVKAGVPQPPYDITLQSYIRNLIHHPENTENIKYTKGELRTSINKMIDIVRTFK